jgi:hypothetical protein
MRISCYRMDPGNHVGSLMDHMDQHTQLHTHNCTHTTAHTQLHTHNCTHTTHNQLQLVNPFTASCENAMTPSVPGVPESCEKFPHSSPLNFWSTESIFNQFSVFLKTLNTLCVCLLYKHPRSMKRVIRSDKPVTLLLLFWSHKCDNGAEPRSRIIYYRNKQVSQQEYRHLRVTLTCSFITVILPFMS